MNYQLQRYMRNAVMVMIAAQLGACATTTKLSAELAPRALSPNLQVRRIAVMEFRGPSGLEVSRELESDLVNHQFNGKPYFTVVDRDQTRQLMREFGRDLRGEINPATAVKFGKQIGAQAILFGLVTQDGITQSYSRGTRVSCIKQNAIGFCTRSVLVPARCVIHDARFAVTTRLVNVETAQVVYTKVHLGTARADSCAGTMLPNSSLLANAWHQALDQVVPDIAPSNVVLNVALKTNSSTLSKENQKHFSGAVAFARDGRLGRACKMWQAINNSGSTKDVAVLYDLSICAEANGRLSEALDILNAADQQLSQPDAQVNASLKRIRMEISQRHRLSAAQ